MSATVRQRQRRIGAPPRGRTLLRVFLTLALTAVGTTVTVAVSGAPALANEYYNSIQSASPANRSWMSGVPDSTNLAWMSVPGTHDSLALCGQSSNGGDDCETISTYITKAQENHGYSAQTLTTQLNAGIRSIDIRVRVNKDDAGLSFTIHHGIYYQYANFTDVLGKVSDFLAANPSETVMLNLKAECTGGTGSCNDADGFGTDVWRTKIFDSYLQGRAYTGDGDNYTSTRAWKDLFWAPSVTGRDQAGTPTLGEIRGKVVLLGFRGTSGGIYSGYGVNQLYPAGGSNAEYVQDDYNVTTIAAIDDKWEKVRAHLRRTNGVWDMHRAGEKEYGYQPDALYMNYTSGSGGAYPATIAGGTPTANGVNEFLIQCLHDTDGRCPEFYPGRPDNFGGRESMERMGIMMMDFPGGGLIDEIVKRNPSGHDLKVMVVGDSMTQGHEGDWTWRYRLWQWFTSRHVAVDFVGPYTGTKSPDAPAAPSLPPLQGETPAAPAPPDTSGAYAAGAQTFDSDHFAVWGRQAYQDKDLIRQQVATYHPDLLLVGLGFNDMGWFVSGPDGTLASMKTLVDQARAANPDIRFALANVPQRTSIGGREDLPRNTDTYNQMLADAIPSWSTSRSPVALVDWRGNYSCETGGCPAGYDGLHPNALGEYQIAQAFERTLHDSYRLGSDVPAVPADIAARPTPVPGKVAATSTPGGVTVTWDAVFGALGYTVRSRLSGATTWNESRASANRFDTTWTTDGQQWEYQVRTDNGDQLKSGWSPTVTATAHPQTSPPPVGIVTHATATGVDVAWGQPTGNYTDTIDRYQIITYDKDTPGAYVGGTAVKGKSVHIDGLTPGHHYVIAVATWNAAGGGMPGVARPVTIGAGTPPAPTGLQVTSTDPTTVQLTWNGSSQAAGYRIWIRNINNGSQSTADENIVESSPYGVAYLFPGVWNYEFCITAVNGAAESGKSNCVVAPRPAGS
jgi:lysophospholipase L1-like esterase